MAALVTNAVVTVLLLATWRRAELVYSVVFHLVAATYLVLFSTGNNDPAMAYVLGFVAVAGGTCALGWQSVVGTGRQSACARLRGAAGALGRVHDGIGRRALCRLVAHDGPGGALVATGGQGPAASRVALRYDCRARDRLLLEVAGKLVRRCHLSPWSLLAAFGLWVRRRAGRARQACDLRRAGALAPGYEYPFFNSAIAAGAIALALRVNLSWTAQWHGPHTAWLPLGLSLLCVLMVRAYPSRICVHAGLLVPDLVDCGADRAVARFGVLARSCRGRAGRALLALERVLRPIEPALCQRAGVVDVGFSPVLRGWARRSCGMSACLATAVLVDQIAAALIGPGTAVFAVSSADWWAMAGGTRASRGIRGGGGQ